MTESMYSWLYTLSMISHFENVSTDPIFQPSQKSRRLLRAVARRATTMATMLVGPKSLSKKKAQSTSARDWAASHQEEARAGPAQPQPQRLACPLFLTRANSGHAES